MEIGAITEHMDVAQITLYVFWVFFIGLVFYLQRESRREGYPLVNSTTGEEADIANFYMPAPKTFHLHDGSTVSVPNDDRDPWDIKAQPIGPWSGAPLEPTGDAMKDMVGPAAIAMRADKPDVMHDGAVKIVPLRAAKEFSIVHQDADPRGFDVVGYDGEVAGTIADVWVDKAEQLVRYLEVDVKGGVGNVLVPMTLAVVSGRKKTVEVEAVMSAHFKDAPKLKSADQITLLEEEKVSAYFSSGHMYATPQRQGPLI